MYVFAKCQICVVAWYSRVIRPCEKHAMFFFRSQAFKRDLEHLCTVQHMARIHPSDPHVAYLEDEWDNWCTTKGWSKEQTQQVWNQCLPEELVLRFHGMRTHPIDNGTKYSFLQTHAFCQYNVDKAIKLWTEMRDMIENEAPDYGQWSGADAQTISGVCVFHPRDEVTDNAKIKTRRAWSVGQRMERAPTLRHPDKHPVHRSFDGSWIGAD